MPRKYTLRTMKDVKKYVKDMEYPYSCIGGEYSNYQVDSILVNICVETEVPEPGDFPNNIQEHFWIRAGENDGDDWISCGKLTNGSYFLYCGGCDYTGFDCQGGMKLWVNKSWQRIIDHAMDERTYKLYQEQTS